MGTITDRNAILFTSLIGITKTLGVAIGVCVWGLGGGAR